jgi:DNA integrity scanning protein DisA with diadenylate cyclase activity
LLDYFSNLNTTFVDNNLGVKDTISCVINIFYDFFFKNFFFKNINFILNYFDNIFLIVMIYFFFKSLILSLILELIWPTHLFNKKNNISFSKSKKKSFIDFSLKHINYNSYFFLLNSFFIKY